MASACAPLDNNVSKEAQGISPKDPPAYRDLQITLEEAYNGCLKKVMVSKKMVCKDGHSEMRDKVLTIKVPPGAISGMTFTFPNEGDQGTNKQPG